MLACLTMCVKYKSSETDTLAMEEQFCLFIQQMLAEYLLCSSVCYNGDLPEMVLTLGS